MKRQDSSDKSNPAKAYNDQLNERGSELFDTPEEVKARDKAKVERAISGRGQKMDSVHPDDLKQTRNDEMIEQERSDD